MKFPPDFKPKKSLGQSFLVSDKIADKLASALELSQKDIVLEIGAGFGILTTRVCENVKKVYAIEIDKRLIPFLHENTKQYNNIEIINKDILKLDWQKFDNLKIIGNIPYNISSEILLKLLENIRQWFKAVLTTQREFTNKLLASPGMSAYSATSVLFDFYTERKKILTIPSSVFQPSPNIVSTAVVITKRTSPLFNDINLSDFYKVVTASFKQPRKTIANNLSALNIDKNSLGQYCGLDLTRRAQDFSTLEFCQLTKDISNLIK